MNEAHAVSARMRCITENTKVLPGPSEHPGFATQMLITREAAQRHRAGIPIPDFQGALSPKTSLGPSLVLNHLPRLRTTDGKSVFWDNSPVLLYCSAISHAGQGSVCAQFLP
jgi:hypothetical protein